MRFSTQIKPISYVKAHAAELLDRITEEREPIIITQNGEARAVLVDVRSYEETQETMALLQILAIGEQEIADGKTYPIADVVKEIRNRNKANRNPEVPATINRPGGVAPVRPARDRSGLTGRWRRQHSPRCAPRTPTSPPNTTACVPAAGTRRRSVRSSTRSSAPPGTCSPPESSTTTSAPTSSASETPSEQPSDSCANSRRSDTK